MPDNYEILTNTTPSTHDEKWQTVDPTLARTALVEANKLASIHPSLRDVYLMGFADSYQAMVRRQLFDSMYEQEIKSTELTPS